MDKTQIRVFISYSHDSPDHKQKVLDLAQQLRRDGVESWVDQFINGTPEQGWPLWMEAEISQANFVLIVCTEVYLKRFDGLEKEGRGLGATWEGAIIIRQYLYEAGVKNVKYIPVVFAEVEEKYIPKVLRRGTWYILPNDYDKLFRYLTDQPEEIPIKPRLLRQMPPKNVPTQPVNIASTSYKGSDRESWLREVLTFIWNYPRRGGSYTSWSIKDSALMLGREQYAVENPGLGVAIVSSQFAKDIFGPAAQSRVEDCIRWALSQSQLEAPYIIQVETIDPITFRSTLTPDYRHTVSLGVILARWMICPTLQRHFLEAVLKSQNSDGGWRAEASYPLIDSQAASNTKSREFTRKSNDFSKPHDLNFNSDIFTVLYSIEFLDLCSRDNRLTPETKERASLSLADGLNWMVREINGKSLWASGIMKDYAWDALWISSWITHRLVLGIEQLPTQLLRCIERAIIAMLRMCGQTDTWRNSSNSQVFRVKARVAAATAATLAKENLLSELNPLVLEEASLYLNSWRDECLNYLKAGNGNELDLATSIFILTSLATTHELKEIGRNIIENDLSL